MRLQGRGEWDRGALVPPMGVSARLCGSDGFRQGLEGERGAANQAEKASR